jgi:hypothetical protein
VFGIVIFEGGIEAAGRLGELLESKSAGSQLQPPNLVQKSGFTPVR